MDAAEAADGLKSAPESDVGASNPSVPDVERPPPAGVDSVSTVIRRWKREDRLEKGTLILRALAWFFSLVSLIVMATNKHGDWKNYDLYQEYRYCLAISVLAFFYSTAQILRQVHRLITKRDLVPRWASALVDFTGDQISAYLLMSALSAAIPITNRMREGADNMFTDASSVSISMAFFAFVALALSALISGFKLSRQNYI